MQTFITRPDFVVTHEDFPISSRPYLSIFNEGGTEVVHVRNLLWNFGIELPDRGIVYPYCYNVGYFIEDPRQNQTDPQNWHFSHINLWRPASRLERANVFNPRRNDDVPIPVTLTQMNEIIVFSGYTVQSLFEAIITQQKTG
jgi:hypothetical protein